jgi:hypothetical protein
VGGERGGEGGGEGEEAEHERPFGSEWTRNYAAAPRFSQSFS